MDYVKDGYVYTVGAIDGTWHGQAIPKVGEPTKRLIRGWLDQIATMMGDDEEDGDAERLAGVYWVVAELTGEDERPAATVARAITFGILDEAQAEWARSFHHAHLDAADICRRFEAAWCRIATVHFGMWEDGRDEDAD